MAGDTGSFGPEKMWPMLAAVIAVVVVWKLLVSPSASPDKGTALLNVVENGQARVERIIRADCERQANRVWVEAEDGVECIAYATAGKFAGAGVAVVDLHGDVRDDDMARLSGAEALARRQKTAEQWSQQYDVPFVIIGRPGLFGSSGLHLLGGRRDEAQVIELTIAELQRRLGFRRVAVSGQSGGARIVAQLMVLGRIDIVCAAMGAGAYDVPQLRGGGRRDTDVFGDPGRRYLVPLREVARVPQSADRRSYVIGDSEDQISLFAEAKQWADKLTVAGHHVQLIEARAKDTRRHDMSRQAVAAAALCAKIARDEDIMRAVKAL